MGDTSKSLWYESFVAQSANNDAAEPASLDVPQGSRGRLGVLFAAFALAILAVVIRIPGIDEAPIEFQPTRQYRSLILARSFALPSNATSPSSAAARAAAEGTLALEPPLIEFAAATVYRVSGRERIWIGRLLSVLSWVCASFLILALGRRFGGNFGGITAMAVFLFNPYAVVSSRSFQPDPTMVSLIVLTLWITWRFREEPSLTLLIAAGVSASVAALLKPTAWIFTIIPFLTLILSEDRMTIRRRLLTGSAFSVMVLSAPLLYYIPALFLGDGLTTQALNSFSLTPLVTAEFWRGWVALLERLPGFVILVGGLAGLAVSPPGQIRRLLFALWCGYPIVGFLFTYHFYTHDYYGLPVLVAASLSIGVLAGKVVSAAEEVWPDRTGTLLLAGILLLAVLLAAGSVMARVTAIGGLPIVKVWRDAGGVVGHSSRTIFLARWYGKPLQYHGELAGYSWPAQSDFDLAERVGHPQETAERTLSRLLTEGDAEYFVVTDLEELEKQDDLAQLLVRFPLLFASQELLVFDLRGYVPNQGRAPPS